MKTAKKIRKVLVVSLVLVTALNIYLLINEKNREIDLLKKTHGQEMKITREKQIKLIDELKNSVVNDIRYQEVPSDVKEGELFYTNDPTKSNYKECKRVGGRRSINCDSWGVMQFKIRTVQYYSNKLRGESLTDVEALMLALNEKEAKELAKEIIFNEVGGVWNWSTTHDEKKYFDKQINAIRDLEKELGLDVKY